MMSEAVTRIAEWRAGRTAPPYSIELSPTLRCNFRCQFCWQHDTSHIDHTAELPDAAYWRIVEEGQSLGVKEWRLIGGGDALCRLALVTGMMERIKRGGMFGYLCTNGSLFNPESIRKVVQVRWDHVKVSFESPEPTTQDRLSGIKGSHERITRNLRLFSQFKKAERTDKPFLEIGLVLTSENFLQLPGMITLANELGVQAVFAEPITVYTELGATLKIREEFQDELNRVAAKAVKLAARYGIQTNISDFIKERRLLTETGRMHSVLIQETAEPDPFLRAPCYEPWYRMGIRVDGVVCPCGFYDVDSTENIAVKSLADIWYGPYFQLRRKQILDGSLPAHCARCCTTLVVENQRIREQLIARGSRS